MCAGCEFVTQQVTQQPSTIVMVLGYMSSAIILMCSYLTVFSKRFAARMHRLVRHIPRIGKRTIQYVRRTVRRS